MVFFFKLRFTLQYEHDTISPSPISGNLSCIQKYRWHEYQRRMRASINFVATRYAFTAKKAGNNTKETNHAPSPNCKFSYVCTSKIVFTTWLVLRTTKCYTRNRILCLAKERQTGGEREREKPSGFENYTSRVALVSPRGGSLHTQVEKKSHSRARGTSALFDGDDQKVPKLSRERIPCVTYF